MVVDVAFGVGLEFEEAVVSSRHKLAPAHHDYWLGKTGGRLLSLFDVDVSMFAAGTRTVPEEVSRTTAGVMDPLSEGVMNSLSGVCFMDNNKNMNLDCNDSNLCFDKMSRSAINLFLTTKLSNGN